uniref:LRRCT domain-containing protein n=1 Tax=Syphacia muris TaxID=451379 RepID=A0A0N5AFW6_9BILA
MPFGHFSRLNSQILQVLWAYAAFGAVASIREDYNDIEEYRVQDQINLYHCTGSPLLQTTACQCRSSEELECINAQITDLNVFNDINKFYRYNRKITLRGNNFNSLPEGPLFGNQSQMNLELLNLSANYIVNISSNSLKGMPNLMILDLSNNEIVLHKDMIDFLSHTPRLHQLYLRRAFTAMNKDERQLHLLMKMFEKANLQNLSILDLSYNFFTAVPYNLPCPFPSLMELDLKQNYLQSFDINTSCIGKLRTLDISRNNLSRLSDNFMNSVASRMKNNSIILNNHFICDCNSSEYIYWIRNATTVVCFDFSLNT